MQQYQLICEDSVEGILTGIYEAYTIRKQLINNSRNPSVYGKIEPVSHENIHLQLGEEMNYSLFTTYLTIEKDTVKSEKVLRTIWERLGQETYLAICRALASEEKEKADAVYHTVVTGLSENYKGDLMDNLANDSVRKVFELNRYVENEILHIEGFLRFRELKNGILYADYGPKNNLLTLIMPHFSNRFPNEDFAIHDVIRGYYGIHPKQKEWYLVRGEENPVLVNQVSEEELIYQELFRHFHHTIGIKERTNKELQRNMLPLRFRGYMTEF